MHELPLAFIRIFSARAHFLHVWNWTRLAHRELTVTVSRQAWRERSWQRGCAPHGHKAPLRVQHGDLGARECAWVRWRDSANALQRKVGHYQNWDSAWGPTVDTKISIYLYVRISSWPRDYSVPPRLQLHFPGNLNCRNISTSYLFARVQTIASSTKQKEVRVWLFPEKRLRFRVFYSFSKPSMSVAADFVRRFCSRTAASTWTAARGSFTWWSTK